MAITKAIDYRPAGSQRTWLPVFVLIVVAMLWSLNGPLIKLLQKPDGDFPPVSGLTIACYRSLIGAAVLMPFAIRRRKTLNATKMRWVFGSVFFFTLMTVTFVVATTKTAAANVITLQYTAPIWVFLASPLLLRERPRLWEGAVLVVSLVGVGVMFGGMPSADEFWLCVALVSGFGYGMLIVMLRGVRAVDPLVVATMNILGSGVLLLVPVAMFAHFSMSPTQWLLMVVTAIVQFTLPYVLFSWALRSVAAHSASLIVLMEAVLNPLLTFIIVGEIVPMATMFGGPLVLLGVVGWMLLKLKTSKGRPDEKDLAG